MEMLYLILSDFPVRAIMKLKSYIYRVRVRVRPHR